MHLTFDNLTPEEAIELIVARRAQKERGFGPRRVIPKDHPTPGNEQSPNDEQSQDAPEPATFIAPEGPVQEKKQRPRRSRGGKIGPGVVVAQTGVVAEELPTLGERLIEGMKEIVALEKGETSLADYRVSAYVEGEDGLPRSITLDDVRAINAEVGTKNGVLAVRSLLTEFAANRVGELKEEQYGAYYARARQVLGQK